MPLYEYRCESCGHQFEVIQKFSDALVSVCPKCGAGPVVKLLSSPAIQFKGSGFYITDYARKDSKGAEGGQGADGGKGGEKGKGAEKGKSADTTSSATTSSSDSTSATASAPKSDTSSTNKT
jgi:putative FmdB family regulatory protein